jgi:hypothetical protein
MMMNILIAVIIFIIILTEFYSEISNLKINTIPKNDEESKSKSKPKSKSKDIEPMQYNEYIVKGGKIIMHLPGYIYTKENFNLFIKENEKTLLVKKNKIYKIESNFTIEILDVSANSNVSENSKNVIYYYIKSQ